MTLASQMVTDLSTFLNTSDFAVTATYNSASVTVDLQPGEQQMGSSQFARTAKPAICHVKSSDVAAPAINDAIVIGSVTYTVVGVPATAEGGLWTLEVQAEERPIL